MANTYPDAVCVRLIDLCATYLRPQATAATDSVTGDPILTFVPALSSAEQATFADLLSMAKQHITGLSLAEFQALKPTLVEIRSLRTRTLAQWNALTATQREADQITYLNDLTDVLRAILRDS